MNLNFALNSFQKEIIIRFSVNYYEARILCIFQSQNQSENIKNWYKLCYCPWRWRLLNIFRTQNCRFLVFALHHRQIVISRSSHPEVFPEDVLKIRRTSMPKCDLCFPVNLLHILRTLFLKNTSEVFLLKQSTRFSKSLSSSIVMLANCFEENVQRFYFSL